MVISAGPAVNLMLAFVLLFVFFFLIGPETATTKVGVIEKGFPAAELLEPGDRIVSVDGKRGDASDFQSRSPRTGAAGRRTGAARRPRR